MRKKLIKRRKLYNFFNLFLARYATSEQMLTVHYRTLRLQVHLSSLKQPFGSLFSEINVVLTTGLDKIVTIFKRRDPNFFNGYQAARMVIDN